MSDFPVHWDDPADEERSWTFDIVHNPDPLTPLGFDLYYDPFIRGFGTMDIRHVNYYVYLGRLPGAGQMPPVGLSQLRKAGENWRQSALPEVIRHTDHYLGTDFDSCSDQQLVAEIGKLREVRARQGQLHTQAMAPWMICMNQLADVYQELTGGDDLSAMRLVQGYGNKSVEAGQELWNLTRLLEYLPEVRGCVSGVTRENGGEVMRRLSAMPEAKPFLEAFSSYLDEYGWRADMFELATPTWAEEPTIPLCQLRAYLELPNYDPAAELARQAEERDAAIRDALEGLDGAAKARLQAHIEVSAELVSIQEDHNFYIDQRLGFAPRRLVLAAGGRLASQGACDAPEDVFYLRTEELTSALGGEVESLGSLISGRKADMARWSEVSPPAHIGAPPEEGPRGFLGRFWGTPQVQSERPNELTGNGASAGMARGPARILRSLSEADRLGRGDVLVARTTMPAWTPLFAVASAIVTESGGVLSHAAVVAREYGIPAVLSVGEATRRVKDGQLVEVDGDNGLVRIVS